MCGFVASVRRYGAIDRRRLADALRLLAHRGPDASGIDVVTIPGDGGETVAEVGFGHARLSIVDLDPRSNQPFVHAGDRLVYNGEIYNHRSLAAGMQLTTAGDTEVVARLLRAHGPAGLTEANGMWAFCWLDSERGRLVAGRDRYGKKPLFYAVEPDAVHFASEPAALAELLARPLTIRADALDSFVADGWLFPDASGATHLAEIREVRPGRCLTLDLRRWSLEERHSYPFAEADADATNPDRLAEVFADAVEARLMADRRVGLFLSGGVDSSLILSALAARGLAGGVFCITGDAGRSDDARYARACVEQLGIEALNVAMPYDSLGFEQFLAVCRAQMKPFPLIGNVMGMHALYAAVAQHDIPVILDGTGADEIFGGYWHRYFGHAMRDARLAGDEAWIREIRPVMPNYFATIDARSQWMPARETLEASDVALLAPGARALVEATAPQDPMIGFEGTVGQAMRLDATAGRMQEWLWQNDRNAMAAGIENRSPFLDHRLFAWTTTPYNRKFSSEWNKCELRGLFERYVPLPTATRRDKQGFRWAYDQFLRNNLATVLEMIDGSRMVRRYVDPRRLADRVRDGSLPLESRLLHRMTVLAGLEAVGLSGPDGASAAPLP